MILNLKFKVIYFIIGMEDKHVCRKGGNLKFYTKLYANNYNEV